MISPKQMKLLEELSEKHGISRLMLMQNAGRAVFDVMNEEFSLEGKKVLVVCYHGNNGGDGFVAAHYLQGVCKELKVLFAGDEKYMKKEASVNYNKLDKRLIIKNKKHINFDDYDIIIDALLGTGIKGKIKEPLSSLIDEINRTKAKKISLDVPTGIDPDSGKMLDKAVEPDLIIAFHDIKKGLESYERKTIVVDIGIPELVVEEASKND